VRAGKIASLTLLLVLVGLFALVQGVMLLSAAAPARAVLVSGAILLLLYALVLLPLGAILDRELARLLGEIEHAGGEVRGAKGPAVIGPAAGCQRTVQAWMSRWLGPLSTAFIGAVEQFRRREQALRLQLRDMEIRRHVSEAERRQVEAVLHALRDAVIVTDAFNEIVMANKAAAEIFGFDLEKAIHAPIQSVIHDARLCKLIADAREAPNFHDCRYVEHEIALTGEEAQDEVAGDDGALPGPCGALALRRPAPPKAVYEVTLVCVENHKREVGGVVTILHDRTRERELSQMKTDFVSKASHELRTPLASIRAYVEMLVDGEFDTDAKPRKGGAAARRRAANGAIEPDDIGKDGAAPSAHDIYRVIQAETDRLGRLIDNMLNISRIEAGIVQIERESVDMTDVIRDTVQAIEPQARERSLNVTTRLAGVCSGGLCVEGDRDMLQQVLLNLLSNAVKYTPEGGRINVSADTDNLTRSVVVTVSDTGLGIPPDALPRLFDKFYRVENYKRVAKGTGLGLSLCKHIVEIVHQGSIGVESKLGMGSRFWFSIPMTYAGSAAAKAA
jgi:two-component system, OmpR family, phosphate regulon sensor histidine kinase PhoR